MAVRVKTKAGLQARAVRGLLDAHPLRPALSSGLDFIFGNPLPADQKARIDRYTGELTDAIEKVALAALAARSPASLAWGQGRLGFAANRRVLKDGRWVNFGVNPNGPVDHSLPVLRATDSAGKVRAVLFGYACHCTTLGGEFNKICADWAGYACDEIERQSPGSIALAIIGCGADANPEPRRGLDDAKGTVAAAREVDRLVRTALAPLPGRIDARFHKLELPLEPPPSRDTLEQRTKRRGRGLPRPTLIERLDRGETLPPACRNRANLVLRRRDGDGVPRRRSGRRLCVAAQVGDRPEPALDCRVQQRRAMLHPVPARLERGRLRGRFLDDYYGHPSRLAPATEDLIIRPYTPSCPRRSTGRGDRRILLVTPPPGLFTGIVGHGLQTDTGLIRFDLRLARRGG